MPVDDYPVRHLLDAEVQRVAAGWRKKLNSHFLSNCIDVPSLFAAAGTTLKSGAVNVELRPDEAMGRANAFVSPDRSTVYFRESVVKAAATGDVEAVFDAVHELGHIVLHRAEIPLARMATRDNQHKFLQPEESAEHQANVFARSFLMTDDEVALFPSEEALAENCCTPLHQARLRLVEYGRTTGRVIAASQRTAHLAASPWNAALIEARLKGYEPAPCPECRNMTLVRSGACVICETCGSTDGCS